jgi:hypothetical protein
MISTIALLAATVDVGILVAPVVAVTSPRTSRLARLVTSTLAFTCAWQGDYGGGPRRRWPDAPQHGGGGSDPSWWPEFGRQLAFYLKEGETKRQVAVRPAEPARHVVTRIPV